MYYTTDSEHGFILLQNIKDDNIIHFANIYLVQDGRIVSLCFIAKVNKPVIMIKLETISYAPCGIQYLMLGDTKLPNLLLLVFYFCLGYYLVLFYFALVIT